MIKKGGKNKSDEYYYALVEYAHSTMKGKLIYHDAYVIIYRDFAYIKTDSRKSIKGKHFWIKKEFNTRPDEMPEEDVNTIIEWLKLKNPKIVLRIQGE